MRQDAQLAAPSDLTTCWATRSEWWWSTLVGQIRAQLRSCAGFGRSAVACHQRRLYAVFVRNDDAESRKQESSARL